MAPKPAEGPSSRPAPRPRGRGRGGTSISTGRQSPSTSRQSRAPSVIAQHSRAPSHDVRDLKDPDEIEAILDEVDLKFAEAARVLQPAFLTLENSLVYPAPPRQELLVAIRAAHTQIVSFD